jgi:glycerol-3-phosphate acyltransferase PlsY
VTPESLNQWWWLALAGYFLGSIPFGYLVARRAGVHDIRDAGSGNIGATNVARTLGAGAGALTFFLDAAKGFFAVWLARGLTHHSMTWMVVAGVGAVLGHVYPLWLGGKGGRGVATAAGAFVLICWPAVAVAVAIWITVLVGWRYVSLASIAATAALPVLTYLLYAREFAPPRAVSIGVTLVSMLVLWRHKDNLGRLATGTEPRLNIRRERE